MSISAMKQALEALEKLWDIIDDIDTYGDMAKSDDKLYRSLVERRQRQRFEQTGISTDGYELNGGAITALRQAIAEAENIGHAMLGEGKPFYRSGKKISLSAMRPSDKFILVRTGQVYSIKDNGSIWNETENRPSRLHKNCQVEPLYPAHVHASDMSQERVDETAKRKHEPVAWHEPGAYGNVTTHKDWALANGWEPLYKEKNT